MELERKAERIGSGPSPRQVLLTPDDRYPPQDETRCARHDGPLVTLIGAIRRYATWPQRT